MKNQLLKGLLVGGGGDLDLCHGSKTHVGKGASREAVQKGALKNTNSRGKNTFRRIN